MPECKPKKKNIMRKFRMDEISSVDSPAQAPALAVIMKNDRNVAKAAFLEALTEMKTERKVHEALDEMWDLNFALRRSIEEIVENEGNKYPDVSVAVKESLSEFVTAVEEMIADATGDITAAAEGDIEDEEIETEKADKVKTEGGKKFSAADYAYAPDPDKPSTWKLRLTNEPGGAPDPRIVGAAIAALGEGFRGKKVVIPDDDRPAVIARVRAAWKKANPDKTKDDLPDILKSEEGGVMKTENQTPTVEQLQAQLAKANQVAELSDVQKAHYNGLSDAEKEAFLKLDADGRQKTVEKAQGENPVIYKSDSGEEFRKSDDPRLVRLAKQADEDRKLAKAERDRREAMELSKRAETDLSHLPGDETVKVAVLKALDGITDETTRTKAHEMLKSQNATMAQAFIRKGTTQGAAGDGSAVAKLDALAKKYAEDHKVNQATAYGEVLKTDEGKALYEQTL